MSDEYTKHSVHTDALETLGTIIGPEEKRDAIHLAVYPVCAGERLRPGSHVLLGEDGLAYQVDAGDQGVGIVDPFLRNTVGVDERFWLVVYPREISSLRHVWEHHAFPASGEAEELLIGPDKHGAERWLRNFADEMNVEFDGLIQNCVEQGSEGGDYVTLGEDANGNIPDLLWDHLEIYTGKGFPRGRRPVFFSCAC